MTTVYDDCPAWCDSVNAHRHLGRDQRIHVRLVGEVAILRGRAEVGRARVFIHQYPGADAPVAALRSDGEQDFGRWASRCLSRLFAEAERILRESGTADERR